MTNKYKLVPIEPTEEMVESIRRSRVNGEFGDTSRTLYMNLLEAAPPADVIAIDKDEYEHLKERAKIDHVRQLEYWKVLVKHGLGEEAEKAISSAPADVEPVLYAIKNHELALKMHNGQTLCAGKPSELHCVPLYTQPPADKDAERYRWLRDERTGFHKIGTLFEVIADGGIVTLKAGNYLDEAIDKAMGEV